MDLSALRYAKTHEWAALEGDVVTVGITAFAAEQLGDITYLELPKLQQKLSAGDEFGVVESVKSTSPLYAPVSGEVIEVNSAVVTQAEPVQSDPFGAGWLVKFRLAAGANLDHLLSRADYERQLAADGM